MSKVVNDGVADTKLYDMEAAGIYQAGSSFLGPHQISFVKIVSDAGTGQAVTPKDIERIVASYKRELVGYIGGLKAIVSAGERGPEMADDGQIARVVADLKLSVTMENELRQNIRYCKLSGFDWKAVFDEMYVAEKIPVSSKREGKIYLEEFKRRIL